MKTFLKTLALILIIVGTEELYAQIGSDVPMLYLNPSPKFNGLGMTGTALPNEDPAGFYYNPAQLGYISQNNIVSFQDYPSDVNWYNHTWLDLKYRNTSFNIGYNFKDLLGGLNLSAGFGYIHSKFDFGNFYIPISTNVLNLVDQYDQYDAYGFGVGIDYYLQFNIGFTFKNILSHLIGYANRGQYTFDEKNYAFDYGFLLTIPVAKLVAPKLQLPILEKVHVSPYLNISFGYSQLNIGNDSYFAGLSLSDQLPRTARLGYAISTGINIKLNNSTIKAINYDFTVDADDELVETNPYTHSYQEFLGDIKIGKNLIGLNSDDNVIVHKGHNVNLFETISFQIGRFDGRGYDIYKSSGFGIQTRGLFALLKIATRNNIFNFIANHLDVQYYSSKLFESTPIETKFEGINLVWYGMML